MVPNKISKEKLKLNKTQNNNNTSGLNKSSSIKTPERSVGSKKPAPSTTTTTTASENAEEDLKAMVGGCCVCADDTGYANNLLVYCDGCDVAVHQGCYGIITVPDGDWFCRKCEYNRKNEGKNEKVNCQLCPSKEGAIKRTDTTKWAHVVCALFIPEISFGNNRTMEPIITKDIHQDRLNRHCSICEEQQFSPGSMSQNVNQTEPVLSDCSQEKFAYTDGHVYVNCNKPGCKEWFHVTCAQAKGLLCEDTSVSQNNVTYCIYCKGHLSKLTNSDIKRIPAFISDSIGSQEILSTLKPAKTKRKSTSSTTPKNKEEKPTTKKQNSTDKLSAVSNDLTLTKVNPVRSPRTASLNTSKSDSSCSTSASSKKQKLQTNNNNNNVKPVQVKIEKEENILLKESTNQNTTCEEKFLDKNNIQSIITEIIKKEINHEESSHNIDKINQLEYAFNKPESISQQEITSSKRKLGIDLNDVHHHLSNRLNTPSSSNSSCSSTDLIKSPTLKRQCKPQTIPLTPSPSVNHEKQVMSFSDVSKVRDVVVESESEDNEDSDEFSGCLDDILKMQWNLGSELVEEQSEGFSAVQFLKLLNDCKQENEILERKLSALEANHAHLQALNVKLQEPLNTNIPEKPKPATLQKINNQTFQPIKPETPCPPTQLPKTPTKQSINSLLLSASPISSASSPNNSLLQNISLGTPPTHSHNHNSQNKATKPILTSIQTDFYNNRFQSLDQNNQNQNITFGLNGSPIKNGQQTPLYQMNSYQQQLYYAYLLQQQQQQSSTAFPDIAQMFSGINASMLSNPGLLNATSSNGGGRGSIIQGQGNSKSTGSLSKEILEATFSNLVSKS